MAPAKRAVYRSSGRVLACSGHYRAACGGGGSWWRSSWGHGFGGPERRLHTALQRDSTPHSKGRRSICKEWRSVLPPRLNRLSRLCHNRRARSMGLASVALAVRGPNCYMPTAREPTTCINGGRLRRKQAVGPTIPATNCPNLLDSASTRLAGKRRRMSTPTEWARSHPDLAFLQS